MPIRSWIEKDKRRVRSVVVGDFTMTDILATIRGALDDPEFEPGFDVLADHTDIGEPITTAQLDDMIRYLAESRKLTGSRWAVVTRKPASYGMMRMFSALAERIAIEVDVFETFDEAESWLASPRR